MMTARPHPRLPYWSFVIIAAGGILTYCGLGILLIGLRFLADLQSLLEDPTGFAGGDPELMAPFVLLLVPGILGAAATRVLLRIVVGGVRHGDSFGMMAKAIGAFLASAVLLVIAALFTAGKPRL